MQTDWQQFLTQCIETIALVAEYKPQQVFQQVYLEWQKPFERFESIGKTLNLNGSLFINDNQQSDMIYCVLRDIATMCQTLTRLLTSMQQSKIKSFITFNINLIFFFLKLYF